VIWGLRFKVWSFRCLLAICGLLPGSVVLCEGQGQGLGFKTRTCNLLNPKPFERLLGINSV
jgi:hypothetical protein